MLLLVYHSTRPFDGEAWHMKSVELRRGPVMLTVRGLAEWFALLAVLGYARVYLFRPRAWLA